MKQKLYKDISIRKLLKKRESKIISLKILVRLKELNYLEIFNHLSRIRKNCLLTRLHNCCTITSRRHSIDKTTTLSRIKLRELSKTGNLLGFKKISW